MQTYSLLYRVFYDRTLFSGFIKNGKGYGLRALFVLSFFVAFSFALKVFLIFSIDVPPLASKIATQLPEIVIENGRIVSPRDFTYSYVSQEDNLFFVLNTAGDPANFKELPKNGIYVTTDSILFLSGKELRRVPIAKVLNGASVVLNQENIQKISDETMRYLRFFLPPLLMIFSLPGIFCLYFFVSVFYAGFSFGFTHLMGMEMPIAERMRLAALSIMPAYILNTLASLLELNLRFGFLGVFVTLIYMYCFLKDGKGAVQAV